MCRHLKTKELFVLKQFRKARVEELNGQQEVMREKNFLKLIGLDLKGVIRYYQAIMDDDSLWFVFEPCLLGSL